MVMTLLNKYGLPTARVFGYGYGSRWVTDGSEFDELMRMVNVEAGVVAAALYWFAMLGVAGTKRRSEVTPETAS